MVIAIKAEAIWASLETKSLVIRPRVFEDAISVRNDVSFAVLNLIKV